MSKKIIVFSAPSGSGKTSIIKSIMSEFENLSFSISATSRKIRDGEINGKDYYYFSEDEFKLKIKNNEFLEWEEVYKGSYYGTLISELYRIWKNNKNVLFDIDVKGALNIKKLFPEKTILIFIEPPSLEELKKRLKNRKTETEKSLSKRIEKAKEELSYKKYFDFVITNDILENAIQETKKIISKFI